MIRIDLAVRAIVPLLAAALSHPVTGQTVYKCGNVYSEVACPGAVAVDASDSRTAAQKAQTDAAAAQAAKSADKLERDRLKLEKPQANKPPGKAVQENKAAGAATTSAQKTEKKKKKEPEYFTAIVPADKKKEKQSGKADGAKTPASGAMQAAKP